jgi:outer membrane protein assembly factor BamB
MRKEFNANDGYFGAGSTPLVIGDLAIVNVGGSKEGSVVAVRLSDGQTEWQTAGAEASYASPILWRLGDEKMVVVVTRMTTVGLNPENGEVLFDFKFGMRGPTVNAATPIQLSSGEVFLTSSYGIGASMIQPNSNPLSVLFRDKQSLSSQYITPIEIDGRIYGCDGREDAGRTQLVCLDHPPARDGQPHSWNRDQWQVDVVSGRSQPIQPSCGTRFAARRLSCASCL